MTMQEPMSPKEKRMSKAARLRYEKDMDNQSIADELGLKEKTIRNYFASDEMEGLKRFYSDQERFKLMRTIEQDLSDAESIAKDALGDAKSLAEDSSDYRQVAEVALKIRQRKIDLLQELGIIQKPKERKEVENTGGSDTRDKLAEYYKEKMEEDKQEVETGGEE